MRTQLKLLAATLLAFTTVTSYAIQVNVNASSSDVSALGFSVNGSHHGGLGKSYSASDMPAGAYYEFGVRVGGMFGTDVPCLTKDGKGGTKLDHDTTASLNYSNKHCSVSIN